MTRKKRHEIYKEALELYLSGSYKYNRMCVCIAMADHCLVFEVNKKRFPEFYKYEPENVEVNWFPIEDSLSRMIVFQNIIRETTWINYWIWRPFEKIIKYFLTDKNKTEESFLRGEFEIRHKYVK